MAQVLQVEVCLNCLRWTGKYNQLERLASGSLCRVCKNFLPTEAERGYRKAISPVLFIGGFILLLLATVMFTAFPEFEVPLTWTALYSLYLVYFGLAFANFRRKVFA